MRWYWPVVKQDEIWPASYKPIQESGLYYLQSRYYNPEWGRFINADTFVSTGQGILGNNMFAYCRNSPVCRADTTGTLDFECNDDSDELLGNNADDWGGGGFWSGFIQSMSHAANGLSMAMGNKKPTVFEYHHIFSNKNKTYSPQYKEIMDRYKMSLDDENIIELSGHHGRHTNAYHTYMLDVLNNLDDIADGNTQLFYEGFLIIVDFIINNPWLPYAR